MSAPAHDAQPEDDAGAGFNLARLSIERPVVTWLIILTCLFGGWWGFESVGRLEDPAFTIKEAIVVTSYPGASAEEVEAEVANLLETAFQQMDQLDEVRSESSPGRSEIRVIVRDEFGPNELPQVWDELRNRAADAAPYLPPGASEPVVYDDFADVYGILYAVTAPGYSNREIRDIAELMRRELLVVDDVAAVTVAGAPQEHIYVEIPQENLARLNAPVGQVLADLSDENAVVEAGSAPIAGQLLHVEMPAAIDGVAAIENLLVTPSGAGDPIRLSDIAEVSRDTVERDTVYAYHDGERAFVIGVAGVSDANIVDVGAAVEARLAALSAGLPVGVDIHPIYEQHAVVDAAVTGFLKSLLMSVAIVIGVLCLFMGWRAGAAVGAVLLLTVLGTLFFMAAFGITMQRISLGALIIAMGMLVDNAIVVVEGVQVAVHRGVNRMRAAEDAVASTQWPLLGATVIGIMAFSGIGLSPDATGEFLFSLFAVIAVSLLLSWVLAITAAPMIAHALFASERRTGGDPHERGVYRLYAGALHGALRARWLTVMTLIGLTAASVWGFGYVRQSFFPDSNTPLFFVNFNLPQGSDILATDEITRDIARHAAALPDVVSVDAFAGQGAPRFMLTYASEQPDASYGQLIVRAPSLHEIPGLIDEVMGYVEETYPELEARSARLVFGPSEGAKLEARFRGPDARVLRALAEEAVARVREDADVRHVRTDWRSRALALRPRIVLERARSIGVTREDIAEALQFATDGVQIGVYRERDRLIPIVARASADERADGVDALSDRLIWSPAQQAYVPIAQVVERFDLAASETQIQRRDRVRALTVQADPLEGETAASAFVRFAAAVNQVEIPPGYWVEWGGEHEANEQANESLGKVLPISFIVMLATSFLLFQTVRQPLIIWLIVPMALCGVTVGLLMTNVAFSFTGLLGALSLSGMLIKNAIVLVDEVDQRIARGEAPAAALERGSVSRLRPVMLAAGTTILGMTPLVFDAFFQGMAVVIMFGLAFASVLTLIAAPVLYGLFFNIRPSRELPAQSA